MAASKTRLQVIVVDIEFTSGDSKIEHHLQRDTEREAIFKRNSFEKSCLFVCLFVCFSALTFSPIFTNTSSVWKVQ